MEYGKEPFFFPGSLLSLLVQLTRLSLDDMTVSGPSMQHLSCVTGLQVLRLGSHMVGLAALTALQNRQQLTQLQMHVGGEGLSTSTLPAGLCPDTVKHLQLSTAGLFDPALLAPLQQVHDIRLTLRQQGSGSASPALLEQLGKLTQLTSLELCCVFDAAQWSGTAAALLSALTASSNLQELTLDCGRGDRVLSLQDIWPHAFPEQLRMPGLRNLTVRDAAGWEAAPAAMDDDDGKPGVAWPEQCLTHLVSCCPGMHSLDALSISQHVGHLVPLRNVLQLSLLTALTVVGISDTEAHEVAVGLPCLQNLQVGLHSVPGCITATGLSQLSALQLTHLGLTGREAFFFGNIETDDFWDEEEEAAFKAYVPYTVQDSTLASVALLTSLQELHLRDHMNITDAGLLQLSALRQLTRLDVNDAMGLLGYHTEGIWVYLPTEVRDGDG